MKHRRIRHRQRKNMSHALIATSVFCILVSATIAILAMAYFTFHMVLEEKGAARIDVLQQISDSNAVNRMNMVNVMHMVHEDFSPLLLEESNEQIDRQIWEKLQETTALLHHIGMDLTVDIVMNDQRVFTTDEDESNLKNLINSYWYIRHYSGETDTSWNLRFGNANDISSYGLSYGQTIYNAEGKSIGVVVITSAYEALFRSFQKLISDGGTVYILDRNGIIICHSNPQRVGNWMTNMEVFAEEHGRNAYRIMQKGHASTMLTNYWDPDSGWTFVEEQNINSLLWDGLIMVRNCLICVLAGCLLAGWLAYVRMKRVTDVLADFTNRISDMPADCIKMLPVRSEYEETFVLSRAFNGMVRRIRELIADVQVREQEKQRTEYDFLQAQINPHFLNNTLLAVKGLIAMGEAERASRMMNELVELLHIPATPEIQFVTLREELHLVRNYISIMNCRTEKGVSFVCGIPERMMKLYVPRMILQPIVGNAFFHGFAEKDAGCEIRMRAGYRGNALYVEVTDNGEGITPERQREIARGNYRSERFHHGIGLKNVQKRLQIIYGGSSGVRIESELGKFTTVVVTMDHYQAFQVHRKACEEAVKEQKDENYGSR